jgi:hypothetical protein
VKKIKIGRRLKQFFPPQKAQGLEGTLYLPELAAA